ncbi:MAG: DUF1285 domain-containing protein [Alphaproteobacteria bacterium]|nr:DUF1285 domain-containing protein [Alphaproteobacteria bacterium]
MRGPTTADESSTSKNDAEALAQRIAGAPASTGRIPRDCGDLGIRIARDGTWYYRGSPIGRKPLVKLFSTVLRRDEAGTFWLVTPVERGRVTVDDAPFVAVAMTVAGTGTGRILTFTTNLDQTVAAGPDHPIRVAIDDESRAPSPYVMMGGGLEALIARPVFYDLVELGEERMVDGERVLGVWSGGMFFTIGPMER